jgi:hypothetical protein
MGFGKERGRSVRNSFAALQHGRQYRESAACTQRFCATQHFFNRGWRLGSDAGDPTQKGGTLTETLEQTVAATAGGCVNRWGLLKPTTRLVFTSEVCCAYTVFPYI